MKKILLNCFMGLLIGTCTAQDVDNTSYNTSFVQLSLQNLPADIKTYSVSIAPFTTTFGNTLGGDHLKYGVRMNGYELVDEVGDLQIKIKFLHGIAPGKVELHDRAREHYVGKDKPPLKYTQYYYTYTHKSVGYHYVLLKKTGEVIQEGKIGGVDVKNDYGFDRTEYSTAFKSPVDLDREWQKIKQSVYNNIEISENHIGYVINLMREYCMQSMSFETRVKYVTSRKVDYSDLEKARDIFLKALPFLSRDTIVKTNTLVRNGFGDYKKKVKEAIAIWNKALEEFNPDDKKARIDKKVASALFFNLAVAHMWMDEFDKAQEYIKKSSEVFAGKGWFEGTRKLENMIADQLKRYEANKWRGAQLNDLNP